MYYPSLEGFREKAKLGNLIPVWKEVLLDQETPVSAFRKLGNSQYRVLAGECGGRRAGGPAFLPRLRALRGSSSRATRSRLPGRAGSGRGVWSRARDPLAALKTLLGEYTFVPVEDLPRFCGGAVGYLGYDVVRFFERLPGTPQDDLGLPDSMFVLTDTCVIFDHAYHRGKVLFERGRERRSGPCL